MYLLGYYLITNCCRVKFWNYLGIHSLKINWKGTKSTKYILILSTIYICCFNIIFLYILHGIHTSDYLIVFEKVEQMKKRYYVGMHFKWKNMYYTTRQFVPDFFPVSMNLHLTKCMVLKMEINSAKGKLSKNRIPKWANAN